MRSDMTTIRSPRFPRAAASALFAAFAASAPALTPLAIAAQDAVPTRVVVRAVSQDAKIIGSGVGGARIMIRDGLTGQILASGVQEGGTGDTDAILGPRPREGGVFDTEGAAAFRATLDLTAPTMVTIEAEGPLRPDHALQHASTSLLLVPGHHVEGDGVILTLHGFSVEMVEAPTSARAGAPVPVRAKVTMLCGCPTEPGGRWDADRYTLLLSLVQGDRVVAEGTLAYAGETSHYAGDVVVPADLAPGDYGLRVVAVDGERANAGMTLQPIRIER